MQNRLTSRYNSSGFKINYFSWIANFGVVPLFTLDFFLLAPLLFFFAALLFFVTRVLETINPLLLVNYSQYINNKLKFLPFLGKSVKRILINSISLAILGATPCYAVEMPRDVILSRGQSLELHLPQMTKFNVGNKETIAYKFNEKSKNLIIRGRQIGHTEILVWNSNGGNEAYQVSVISKAVESKLYRLSEILFSNGLSAKITGNQIEVNGTIHSVHNYLNYNKIKKLNSEIIIDNVELSVEVRNEILGNIYKKFLDEYKDSIKCEVNLSEILCSYNELDPPHESLKKYFTDLYGIHFTSIRGQKNQQNYTVKIKLIQLEQLDGEELRLGLDQIEGTLGDFLSTPLTSIISKNKVLLAKTNISISTLAEPEIILRPEVPGEIQIGSEIPYTLNRNSVAWKFAGLKIKIQIQNIEDNLKVNFETELTQPSASGSEQQSVSGTISKSSLVMATNQPSKIFQVSLRTQGKQNDQLPYLGAIPILGELFRSKSKQDNFKTITGIIEVKTNEK